MQTDNDSHLRPGEALSKPTAADLLDQVRQVLQDQALVPAGFGVLVAVSGGPDSMALLDMLRRCGQFPLRAAHLNHQLRPGDCDDDESLVRDYCRHWQIPLFCESRDVKSYSDSRRLSLEVAGRELRQAFFASCQAAWLLESPALNGVRVALAHHLDDQAETLLLHLGRGSGLDGLSGMSSLNEPWIRPLLGIRRKALVAYLMAQDVPWRQDLSNESLFTLRNRLRRIVLPAWREALGYDPAPLIVRSATCIREDQAYLAGQAQAAWLRVSRSASSSGIQLDRPSFQAEAPAIQSRILRRAWREVSGLAQDLEWRHVETARSIISSGQHPAGHLDWPRQVDLDWDTQFLCFSRQAKSAEEHSVQLAKTHPQFPLALPGPDETKKEIHLTHPFLPGVLTVHRIDLTQGAIGLGLPDVFAASALAGCVVRLRQPGDRITLPVRNLSKPLRKYFNELAVPSSKRDPMPLVAQGTEVLWFPGAPVAGHRFPAPGLDSASVTTGTPTENDAWFKLEFVAELDNS